MGIQGTFQSPKVRLGISMLYELFRALIEDARLSTAAPEYGLHRAWGLIAEVDRKGVHKVLHGPAGQARRMDIPGRARIHSIT